MENHSICDTMAPSSLTNYCLYQVKPLKTMMDLSLFGLNILDIVDELLSKRKREAWRWQRWRERDGMKELKQCEKRASVGDRLGVEN